MTRRRRVHWSFLGRQPYREMFHLQETLRQRLRAGEDEEHFLLLEHAPVFTIGRNASAEDVIADPEWLAERGVEVHETNRGGKVTYHGPGQLVGYPIINLNPDRRDVRRYVQDLQDVLIRSLADLGIESRRGEEQALIGVWVGESKIASLGVHLSRWITLHGFALNVSTDLSSFGGIVACGLPDVRMTSIEQVSGERQPLPLLARKVARHFGAIFDREMCEQPTDQILGKEIFGGESR